MIRAMRAAARVATMIAAVLVMSGLPACRGGGDAAGSSAKSSALFGEWRLVSVDGESVAPPAGEQPPSLTISEDGRLTGYTGLNNLSGSIDLDAIRHHGFVPSPVATTRRAGPPALMDLERRYLQALERVDRFDVRGDSLTLLTGKTRTIVFERAP